MASSILINFNFFCRIGGALTVIDFPASPTLGQQFTAAGVTWTWDGVKWTASGLSVAYLPLSAER